MSLRSFRRGLDRLPKPKRRELVAICIPCGRHHMPPSLCEMIAQAIDLNSVEDCPYQFARMIFESTKRIDHNRNFFAQEVRKSEADRVFMIDDDMGPPKDWLRLLEIDADVVSGRYLMMKNDETSGLILSSATDFMFDQAGQYLTVCATEQAVYERDGVGTGCIIIRRRVLDDPRMVLPTKYVDWLGRECDLRDEPNEPLPYFQMHYKPNGTLDHGEDVDFCMRARRLGYTVKVDGRNRWNHYKDAVGLNEIERYANHYADFRDGVQDKTA